MVGLFEITTKEEKQEFINMEYDITKYHVEYARQLGITDPIIENYTIDMPNKYFDGKHYVYLLKDGNTILGMCVLKDMVSEYDGCDVVKLIDLYVKEEFRNGGIGSKAITLLKDKFNKRIELSCYYNIPANKFYQKLGLKVLETVYTF